MCNILRGLAARLRQELSFHFIVDVTTLLASVATVVALIFLIHDRRDQADIAAWTLLQTYLQGEPRVQFDAGQRFALETLVRHRVSLNNLDAHGAIIKKADLHGLEAFGASFKRASMIDVDLSGAYLGRDDFEGAYISNCQCGSVLFVDADLTGAEITRGTFHNANFYSADISDLVADTHTQGFVFPKPELDPGAFELSCFRPGHPPHLPKETSLPKYPQSADCVNYWNDSWATRDQKSTEK
ncbi:pentapeptide repeat-containing protein [Caballeronia sp. SEWSISQ10-4 2]|uniref:pentapeptide repeat-containing protein n=1 Tax=Caballeronia sp. SEWSISQ10-4 2 TaxID=2937438 RepID=UPI0026529020|nr:pentapeptide repeat-containing protein [Caballeronia sp. SEWSISQ10-4 2]MDN7180272.1 pentapeptide repeat-containing protein [Caballeronia sp. SEWSISQ10-4 2]